MTDVPDAPQTPDTVPVVVIETATFYFPPGTTYEQAVADLQKRLDGMDYTGVFVEVLRP
jgi:hypothetical protein